MVLLHIALIPPFACSVQVATCHWKDLKTYLTRYFRDISYMGMSLDLGPKLSFVSLTLDLILEKNGPIRLCAQMAQEINGILIF